jgi:hypothetical protein
VNLASLIRSQTAPAKPILIVPSIQDVRHTARKDVEIRVDNQLRECAKRLAGYNFWIRNRRSMRPGIERWDAVNQRPPTFVGLDLSSFIRILEDLFEVRTTSDGPFRLDRCIAALIWEACLAPDTLPEASWHKEIELREAAAKHG